MKKAVDVITLFLLAGIVIPASAAELRVIGFFDNIIPRFEGNNSSGDSDMTRNGDQATFGRHRSRIFFNFIASDDLLGVFALELDNTFGAPARNRIEARCVTGTGAFANEQCGFRNGIDVNNFELKHLYVDFRVPRLPFVNRWRVGGFPANVTPLHSHLLYTMDAGGGSATFAVNDHLSVLLYYVQLEEDLDRFAGSAKIGEDYITGTTLMLKPIAGLDLHLPFVYGHSQAPFGPSLTGGGGPFNMVTGDTINVTTENRYYVGLDSRYRWGSTTIEPTVIYLFGERNFVGGTDADYDAFEAQLVLSHATGLWLLRLKGAYTSGNRANDDINNRGIGNRSDVKGFRVLGTDSFHRFGEWFEILGRSDVDAPGKSVGPVDPGDTGTFDRFGWIMVGVSVEYRMTDALVLEGSAGGFWTPNVPRCPASVREVVAGETVCTNADVNFTGNSTYAGTEVDIGLRYTIMPGLTWTPRFGWAFLGDAWNANNRSAEDAWAFVNRVIYTF